MRLHIVAAAGLVALWAGASAGSAGPAWGQDRAQGQASPAPTEVSAQQKKKAAKKKARRGSRITVRPRSFLDAGTELLPGERKFTDYALPPFYSPYSVLGPGSRYDNYPLPGMPLNW